MQLFRKSGKLGYKTRRRKQLKCKAFRDKKNACATVAEQHLMAAESKVVADGKYEHAECVDHFDESLLERAKTQYQFGDWESLARLDLKTIQRYPDRAKLALLAAAGYVQQGRMIEGRQYIKLAEKWGCDKKIISKMLISGVHNNIGRFAAVSRQEKKAIEHFKLAIQTGLPNGEFHFFTEAYIWGQFAQLGLKPAAQFDRINRDDVINQLKKDIKKEISAEAKIINSNPYFHNRTLTPVQNGLLREFAEKYLGLKRIKPAYVDYLGVKAIQIERNCVGRLATTVQDAIARQLVMECIKGEGIVVLEIGALYGIGLAILYNHAVTRFVNANIVCLDPFDGYYGQAFDTMLNQPVNDLTFKRNMQIANVPDSDYAIIKHYSTSREALSVAAKLSPFNLLVIDGDHSYDGVKYDFETYFPLLEQDGYVIFDDYNAKEWPGVQKFIDEDLMEVSDFEYIGSISRTAIGRRVVQ